MMQAKNSTPSIGARINGERLVVLGWTRAILLQFAHPLVAAGVHEHSGFRTNAWTALRRLHGTVDAMLSLTFGSESDRTEAIDGILAIHRRVRGRLAMEVGRFPAGTPYSAEDADLVLWVHATLMESVPLTYDLLVAPLAPQDRDDFCRDAVPMAVALGARQEDVPPSAAATRDYLDRMYRSGEIAVGPQARELAAALLAPPFGAAGLPATRLLRPLAIGLLPAFIRAQYGFAWGPADEHALARTVMGLRTIRRRLPDALARWRGAGV